MHFKYAFVHRFSAIKDLNNKNRHLFARGMRVVCSPGGSCCMVEGGVVLQDSSTGTSPIHIRQQYFINVLALLLLDITSEQNTNYAICI